MFITDVFVPLASAPHQDLRVTQISLTEARSLAEVDWFTVNFNKKNRRAAEALLGLEFPAEDQFAPNGAEDILLMRGECIWLIQQM